MTLARAGMVRAAMFAIACAVLCLLAARGECAGPGLFDLYYYTQWNPAYLHYNPDNQGWNSIPGVLNGIFLFHFARSPLSERTESSISLNLLSTILLYCLISIPSCSNTRMIRRFQETRSRPAPTRLSPRRSGSSSKLQPIKLSLSPRMDMATGTTMEAATTSPVRDNSAVDFVAICNCGRMQTSPGSIRCKTETFN